MSTFSKGDSVLGNHSADLAIFEATADSCSPLKSLKNTASTTATPRILEEENQASLSLRADNGGEAIHKQKVDSSNEAFLSSLRDFALAKSWQSTPPKPQTLESTFDTNAQKSQSVASLEKVDSSMDCHAIATALARNDRKNTTSKKVDSSDEAFLSSLRDFALAKSWQSTQSAKADSRNFFTSAKQMDCHAIATALARNDNKKADSRIFTQTAQPAHHDSRICGVASGAFYGFWGRARLEVCGYPKIHKIAAMDT